MAIIKKVESMERVICPNGHQVDPIVAVLSPDGYCTECGAKLTKEAFSMSMSRCSKCDGGMADGGMGESWPFCPRCGEKA